MSESGSSSQPLVVYIAGYGRSGSTILDVMLSQQDDSIGCGELAYIFSEFQRINAVCGCGKSYATCPVWGDIFADLKDECAALEEQQVLRESRFANPEQCDELYRDTWAKIFAALSQHGYGTVIDSSKSARNAARRPHFLVNELDLPIKVIHLTRSWSSVYDSVRQGTNREMEGHRSRQVLPVPRAWLGKRLADFHARRCRKLLPAGNFLELRFEDLQVDPVKELRKISEFLERNLDDVCKKIAAGESLSTSHQVGGNRLRLKKEIVFETS